MKIYRGNCGIDMPLTEFYEMLDDDERIDGMLNLIYELEMDESMNYSEQEVQEFQKQLYDEVADYQKKQNETTDSIRMTKAIDYLDKYAEL